MESAILERTITTGSLLLQKHEAVTLWAKSRDHLVGIKPIEYLKRFKTVDNVKFFIVEKDHIIQLLKEIGTGVNTEWVFGI